MSLNVLYMLIWVINIIVMVFELRLLMQVSNADFYSPLTQNVLKVTNPIMNLPGLRNLQVGRLPLGGLLVAWLVALIFWLLMLGGHIGFSVIISVLLVIKCFGYLIIGLMIAQALTSWLPSTQNWSLLFGQLTAPVVNPVRRIVPPIGMIDISLMIVLFLIWCLNAVITKLLFAINITFGQMWVLI